MIKLSTIINESSDSDKLSRAIDTEIGKIDDSMSYVDFAHAVAKTLKDSYGKHLYKKFIVELQRELK